MRRGFRWIVAGGVAILGLAIVGVVGIGYVAYNRLSAVESGCEERAFRTNTPDDFVAAYDNEAVPVDSSPYRIADFEPVAFPSRDSELTIRGWFAPSASGPKGPVVVLVHGRGSCRRSPAVLMPAGMLHRAGFGVLLIDLRNHGESDVDNGRWAGGDKEFRDPLGAIDWLIARGYRPPQIGLFGTSLGAAAVMIATGEEPQVAGVWVDSSYADFGTASAEYAVANGYPSWVPTTAIPVGRLIGDPELGTVSPDEAATRLGGRPLFIAQGLADTTVLPHHAVDLAAAAAIGGTKVEPWLVPAARHTEAMFLVPDAYERRMVEFFTRALGYPGA
jgi:dipeptidyl aminopeptidase/acylaminoacyl peptidase